MLRLELSFFIILTQALMADLAFAETGTYKDVLKELQYVQGDEQGNDKRALKAEMLISSSESKALEQLQLLIKKYKGSPIEPGLHFRQAELYMRRAKSSRFFEMIRKSENEMSSMPAVIKDASSKSDVQKAIAIYDKIQRDFPYFRQMDQVLYNLGFARQLLGDFEKAEKAYLALIQRYPGSDMVPDSHLAVGEMNYERKRFQLALTHFDKVREYPESRVYPYGLYKAAWAHYNLRDSITAMKTLEEVVAFGKQVQQKGLDSKLDLRKEALVDMTIFYEGVYESKDALKYFRKQAGDLEVGPILLRLVDIYQRYSRYNDSRIVAEAFISALPDNAYRPLAHNSLILDFDNLKLRADAMKELKRFASTCDPQSSWTKRQPKEVKRVQGQEAPPVCHDLLAEISLKMADRWLKVWKKDAKAKDVADATEEAFRVYLATQERYEKAKEEEAGKARFAYAELLFQRGKYREASLQYSTSTAAKLEKDIHHSASYAAIVSLQKAVGDKWSDKDEQRFKELSAYYLKNHAKGPYRLDVEFQLGLIAYEKGRLDEAAPVFHAIGEKFASETKGQRAQDLYMDILNIKKDFASLKKYSSQILTMKNDEKRRDSVTKVFEESSFAEIQMMEEKGDLEKANKEYKSFAQKNLKSPLAARAWWNALQIEVKQSRYRDIAQSAMKFYEMFPADSRAKDALVQSAQTYEYMGQLKKSAEVLLMVAKIKSQEESQWKLMAADFFALDGEKEKGRSLYRELLKSADARQTAVILQKLYDLEGDAAGKRKILSQMANSPDAAQAGWARLQMLEETYRSGKMSDAFQEARKLVSAQMPASVRARARFIQARVLEEEFRSQSVKAQAAKVEMVLAMKTEKLDKAQQAYQEAIRLGDSRVTVEALERLAGCYLHYSEALQGMPLPGGLSQEEEGAFRAEIEKLASPLLEKGVETMAQAVAQAKKLNTFDGTVARLQKELNRLNMKDEGSVVMKVDTPEIVLPKVGVGS